MNSESEGTRYRALFISDVHLGTRGCQAGMLLDFLRAYDAETIYLVGDIVDAAAKAHHIARLTDELGLKREQVIACGDGANDLMMMAQAGLSVAFHAKPATRAKADVAINFGGLDSLLNLFES